MLFKYKAINQQGENKDGSIDAVNKDLAIAALQRRSFIVTSIQSAEKKPALQMVIFERVPLKDVVILSRQIATLFEAEVSALKTFTLLASNSENQLLARKLTTITDDLQAGSSISGALEKHPDVFSNFYTNMVKAGEESGQLNKTFNYLADYLDRQYALTTKTRNALIYPAFVIFTFVVVMILMFVVVIPKLGVLIKESGQVIPFFTKIIIGISDFFLNYGIFLLIFLVFVCIYAFWLSQTKKGKTYLDGLKLSLPLVGSIFKKLYLARIADNLNTMLSSGINIVRAIEITSSVVGSRIYEDILKRVQDEVQGGSSLFLAMENKEQIPGIMAQMVQVGEETGSLGSILKTLADFYKREVDDAVDTLVGLIEPIMIVALGIGVGILLVSVLMPIYNIAGGIA